MINIDSKIVVDAHWNETTSGFVIKGDHFAEALKGITKQSIGTLDNEFIFSIGRLAQMIRLHRSAIFTIESAVKIGHMFILRWQSEGVSYCYETRPMLVDEYRDVWDLERHVFKGQLATVSHLCFVDYATGKNIYEI